MRNVVKNVIYAVVLFLTSLVLPSFAQQTQPDTETLTDSSRALQFQIGSNFTLTSFQGATFSYKQHFTSTEAFRIGLSMSFNGDNTDNTDQTTLSDTLLGHGDGNSKSNAYFFQLSSQYVMYLNPGSTFLLYSGAGPFLRYEYTKTNSEMISYPQGYPSNKSGGESKSTVWSPGLIGVTGVEWFASKNISILAEYQLIFRYYWRKSETATYNDAILQKSTRELKQNAWQLSDNGVKFGLTVYFR